MKTVQEQIDEIQYQLKVMQAYADGKEVEYSERTLTRQWLPMTDDFHWGICDYRIKEEPHYRPFANAEECWNEMLKHKPFGWLKGKSSKFNIVAFDDTECIIGKIPYSYANMFDKFTFIDGTPFGIKED